MSTNPLAQINKAEAALANASDIVDILELRTMAKAVEVVALAESFGDVAQQAKIFQLKAERRAGSWLSENIQRGGNAKSHHVTLADIEVSRKDSSRWQLIATIPDDRFDDWIDDKLSRGQEVTAGGARNLARNIQGRPIVGRATSGIYILNPVGCALIGYGCQCVGNPQGGHIIHKGEIQGNKEGRAILVAQARLFIETGTAEIMARQCMAHNIGRLANSPEAKRIQLLQKIYEFGYIHMEEWFEVFLGTFKVWPTDLELERLIS